MAKATLSDADVVDIARRYERRRLEIKALEDLQELDKQLLMAEFAHRGGTTSITHAGVTVTRKSNLRPRWLVDVARDRLRPAVFRRVTTLRLDPKALLDERDAGRISDEDLEAISAATETKPWPVVTLPDE